MSNQAGLANGPNWESMGIAGGLIAAILVFGLKFIDVWKEIRKTPKECAPQPSTDETLIKIVTEALKDVSRTNEKLTTMIEQQGEAMKQTSDNQSKQAQCISELQKEISILRVEMARR
jgi:uncharacterized coiled-coil protein SlyX